MWRDVWRLDLEAKEMSIAKTRGQSTVRPLQKARSDSLVPVRMTDSPGHERVSMERGVARVFWLLGGMLMCTETLPPGSGPRARGKGWM